MAAPLAHEEAGQGAPVVLLHAFPLSRKMWKPQLAGLADCCRVICPDLPGFGDSRGLGDKATMDAMAERVALFLDHLGIAGPIILGGLSMGGYVAFAFARNYPTRLRALILADTRAEPDDETARANRDKLIKTTQDEGVAAVVEAMLPKLVGATTRRDSSELLAVVKAIGCEQKPSAVVAALKAMRDRADATSLLDRIQVPALVLAGSEDELTPPDRAGTMADRLARGELVNIPRAGHLASLESPEGFNDAIRRFVRKIG